MIAALVVGLLAVATMADSGGAMAVIPALLLSAAIFCLAVWLQVRLSLVFSLTFLRRKFIIGDSWELTRGRLWSLFAA